MGDVVGSIQNYLSHNIPSHMWCQVKPQPRYKAKIADKYPKDLKSNKRDNMTLLLYISNPLFTPPLSFYREAKDRDPMRIGSFSFTRPFVLLSYL